MSQSGTTHMGSGGGAGKANFQDLSFTKYIDNASNRADAWRLARRAATSTRHVLTVRKAGGDSQLEVHT